MTDDLEKIERQNVFPGKDTLVQLQPPGRNAHQAAEAGGGKNPAPPNIIAQAGINEDCPEETDQCADNRTERRGHEGQKPGLEGDFRILNRAGNLYKAAYQKIQRRADDNGDNCFDERSFHWALLFFRRAAAAY